MPSDHVPFDKHVFVLNGAKALFCSSWHEAVAQLELWRQQLLLLAEDVQVAARSFHAGWEDWGKQCSEERCRASWR